MSSPFGNTIIWFLNVCRILKAVENHHKIIPKLPCIDLDEIRYSEADSSLVVDL